MLQTLEEIDSKPLGSLIKYSEEAWDRADGRFHYVFPYIEISAVGLGSNEYSLTETLVSEAPSRARQVVRAGDILISLTRPHRGAVARVRAEDDGVIASTGFAVVREVDSEQVNREYLQLCLTASFGSDQMLMRSSGGNYPAITKDELSHILIPCVSLEEQRHLVTTMDAARVERKVKLAEAEALLAGVDDFLLDILGINLPNGVSRQVFAVGSQSIGKRVDPYFHLPKFARIQDALSDIYSELLGGFAVFSKEIWRPENHDNPTFRYIEISAVNPKTGEAQFNEVLTDKAPSRARMRVQAEDIIVSLTRPHHGSIAYLGAEFEGCVASTGFAVIRDVAAHVSREYLWSVLRAQFSLDQMIQRASGGNYPAITEAELGNITVPVPSMETQDVIAAEVRNRHQQARRLREEAESGWQVAKQWFEAQLIGRRVE